MIPKETLDKIRPWMWLASYIALLILGVIHFPLILKWFLRILSLLTPFFYGVIIAFVLNQPMKAIERLLLKVRKKYTKHPEKEPKVRGLSIAITLVLTLMVISILSSIIFPQLIASIVQLYNNCILYAKNFVDNLNNLFDSLHLENFEWQFDPAQLETALDQAGLTTDKIIQSVTNFLTGAGTGIISNISSLTISIGQWVTGFMLSLYLLASKEKFVRHLKKFIGSILPLNIANCLLHWGQQINQTFSSFFSGQLLEACILASIYCILMYILKMPYALLISTVIGLTSIVPMFGAMIGMCFGCVLIFAIDPWMSLFFIVFFQIVQQIENNLIYPRVVGKSVGIPGILVLLSIVVFGGMFGLFGMLVAVPSTAVIYILVTEFVRGQMAKRRQIINEQGLLEVLPEEVPQKEEEEKQ